MILSWEKPEKIMSTGEWQAISADSAPPGVYTPNMSQEDMRRWKAKYVGGKNPRVEIRKTVLGPFRPAPANQAWLEQTRNSAQLLVIVDATTVRVSANGTADFEGWEFDQLHEVVAEARLILSTRGGKP